MIFTRIFFVLIFLGYLFFFSSAGEKQGEIPHYFSVKSLVINNEFVKTDAFTKLEERLNNLLLGNEIAGASVAVAKDGKLLYAKGFGYADVENMIPMEPYHTLRIASVSKLITAVAVFKLVEQGKISLSQRVFGPNGILKTAPYDNYRDKRCEMITVEHLLIHAGGWTRRFGDPMFDHGTLAKKLMLNRPATFDEVMENVLSLPLSYTPGTSSYYSNFGYALLSKVIEVASKRNYEEYVKTDVLAPIGIYNMRIGSSFQKDKAPFEVNYYEPLGSGSVPSINGDEEMVSKSDGGTNMEILSSAGAWISSPISLLQLVFALDPKVNCAKILTNNSLVTMTTPSVIGFSPHGWRNVNIEGDWVRTGTLAATSAIVKRGANGISYAVVCNSCSWRGASLATTLMRFMDNQLEQVENWPTINLLGLQNSMRGNDKSSKVQ